MSLRISQLLAASFILSGAYGCASGPAPSGTSTTKIPSPPLEQELIQDLTAAGHVTPAFQTDPLVTWGPLPAGPARISPPKTGDLIH